MPNHKPGSSQMMWGRLPAMLLSCLLASFVSAQTAGPAPASGSSSQADGPVRYHPNHLPKRAGEYYGLIWGVDSLSVRAVESGELIRFTFHVLDPNKAKLLNDKNHDAFLNVPERHIQLVIPSLEKVGKLRQTNDPEPDRSYWMAFSNPRRTVRRGDHVSVVIGQFHADGLVVE